MTEVIVDGVRYVPVVEANPTAEAIMRALALTHETPEGLARNDGSVYRYLRVSVGEPGYGADASDPTIEQFVAELLGSPGKETDRG